MTVYKETLKSGTVRYRVHVEWRYPDGTVKTIKRVSPIATQRGAALYEREVRQALADGSYNKRKAGTAPTMGEFQERYFRDHVSKLKPSSRSAQETIWRMSLLPSLGALTMDRIDEEAIAKLAGEMRGRSARPKTVNNALSALRTALTHAHEWKLIASVPRFRWDKVPQQKFDFFTFDEADKLIAVEAPMVTVALKTGMRIGELLALQWSDVSLARNQVTVERSVFWEKKEAHEGGTKSGKVRTLVLTSEARAALEQQEPNARNRDGYVFPNKRGKQMTRNEAKWVIWPALQAAGLKRRGWHVCRHTFASHLVMRGADLPTVQQLMGHSTIAMVMKYAHLAPGHLRTAMALLEPRPTAE